MISGIARHVMSDQVSFFLVSWSFFLVKEKNLLLLFEYIVGFELYFGIHRFMFCQKMESVLKCELICKIC